MSLITLLTRIKYRNRTDYFTVPKSYKIYQYGLSHHLIAYPAKDQAFVWCPIGEIMSFSDGDVKNKWCHWCQKFFEEVEK